MSPSLPSSLSHHIGIGTDPTLVPPLTPLSQPADLP